jgi:nitroreductase
MNISQVIDALIKVRRSHFPASYTGEPIDRASILQILENANWAPTHKKTEPWRFQIFTGDGLAGLSEFLSEAYKAAAGSDEFSELKYNKTKNKVLKSSHVLAIIMQRDPEERLPEWEEIAAVACAVQNIWLSCTSRGIGCYWSSPATITSDKTFLNLEDGQRCLGLLYMGNIDPENIVESTRSDINDKILWREE